MIEELASWGAWGAVFSCEVTFSVGNRGDMYPFAGETSFNQLEGLEVKAVKEKQGFKR